MQWVAADPAALDANVQSVTSWSGSSTSPGRLYNLIYGTRIYPVGGGSQVNAVVTSYGDLPIKPHYRIYGPIGGPVIQLQQSSTTYVVVRFLNAFNIGAGSYVDIDSWAKTAVLNGDPTQSVVSSIDWQTSMWMPIEPIPPASAGGTIILSGSSTSSITQVQTSWQDRFLS